MDLNASIATDPRLEELVRRLVDAVHPRKIYLFGSRARGEQRADSDYDVMLLVDNERADEIKLETEAYGALWGFGAAVDVLVMNADAFERRRVVKSSLPGIVDREGTLLYVAC